MFKLKLIVFIFIVSISDSYAQVEIENGQFMFMDTCPEGLGDFYVLEHWQVLAGEPDYYGCDFTNYIEHPYTDYFPSTAAHVGFRTIGDSSMHTDVFGQNLNEVIPAGYKVEIDFSVQSAYMGAWKGECAGIVIYGSKDSINIQPNAVNILDYTSVIELGTTAIIDNDWFVRDTLSFITTDTISSIIISLELVAGCKQYVHFDDVFIKSSPYEVDPSIDVNVLFPNPANNILFIEGLTGSSECEYEITSANGSLALKGGTSSGNINIQKLSSGVYFVKLKFEGHILIEEFVKK